MIEPGQSMAVLEGETLSGQPIGRIRSRLFPTAKVFFLAIAFLSTGCATIIHGTTQKIPITSDPPGAKLTVDDSGHHTTPTDIELKRKEDHVLQFSMDGYHTETLKIQAVLSGAVVGNIIAGGLIGWGVDAASGAQNRLVPETVHVVLKPESPAAATIRMITGSAARSGAASVAVEERLRQLKDLLEKNLITENEYVAERKQALEASRPQLQPDQTASAPSTVTAALPASQEKKRWVKVVSAEAKIFETKPEKGVVAAVLELAKRGDTLEYTGQKEYGGGSYVRSGTYLEVKNRGGKPGWIHEADVVESSRD